MKAVKTQFSKAAMAAGLCIVALSFGTNVSAQTTCDSIEIVTIQYSAVNSQLLEITVINSSSNLFSYPSFILFNQMGDTIAKEEVQFFGIGGGPQVHFMQINPNVPVPSTPFPAVLELYSDFGQTPVCAWNITVNQLCPTVACTQAEIYIVNTGTLANVVASWVLYDDNGQMIQSGNIIMDTLSATHFDTICIAPGQYRIEFFGFFVPTGYVLGITESYASGIGTNTALQNDSTPGDLEFAWFDACTGITNSIADLSVEDLSITQAGGMLQLSSNTQSKLGTILVFNSQGALTKQADHNSSSAEMNVSDLSPGIYVIHRIEADRQEVHKLFIH